MKSIVAGIAVVLVLTLVAVSWHSSRDSKGLERARLTSLTQAHASPVIRASEPAPNANATVASIAAPRSATSASPRDNPFWVETRSKNLHDAFMRLAALGDPAARATAYQIYLRCAPYGDNTYEATAQRIERGVADAATKERQRAAFTSARSRCVGMGSAEGVKAGELLDSLRASADPRTAGDGLSSGDPLAQLNRVLAARQLQDPVAVSQVGQYLLSRDPAPAATYDIPDIGAVPKRMVFDAFKLAACNYGDDCSSSNPYVLSQCVFAGRCDAADLSDHYRTYGYPPGEYQRLLAVEQAISQAQETGQWPPGFWSAPVRRTGVPK